MSLATLPTALDFDQLRAALPYAYPWILIDRVIELEPGKRIVALKNVSGNEWMFPGHFPGRAIYPGVLLVESMAQASILLLSASPTKPEGRFLLAGSRVRFLRVVVPGDQLLIHCSVDKMLSNAAVISAEVTTDQHLAAKATLSLSFGAGR
jgi:3-hydroxyacyl-[acyl-carrier-protein] dehydratase